MDSTVVDLIDTDFDDGLPDNEGRVVDQFRLNQASRYVLVDTVEGGFRIEVTDACIVKVEGSSQKQVRPNFPLDVEIKRDESLLIGLQCKDLQSLEKSNLG